MYFCKSTKPLLTLERFTYAALFIGRNPTKQKTFICRIFDIINRIKQNVQKRQEAAEVAGVLRVTHLTTSSFAISARCALPFKQQLKKDN